jgi:hypothetical protein
MEDADWCACMLTSSKNPSGNFERLCQIASTTAPAATIDSPNASYGVGPLREMFVIDHKFRESIGEIIIPVSLVECLWTYFFLVFTWCCMPSNGTS